MKECTKCKVNKPLEEFNFKNKEKQIRHVHCKECTRNFVKNHYNNNKEYYLAKTSKRNKYLRDVLNAYVKAYLLDHPCVDCGEGDPVVLEFDHTGEAPKSKAISHMIKDRVSVMAIQEEIGKCVVRCANCQKRKTAKYFNWFKQMRP